MKTYRSHSLEETQTIARTWLAHISSMYKGRDGALVVGLSGHLGAGKTAFTKAVARELGITEDITSPTFIILKMYAIPDSYTGPWKRLVHIDAYRLERSEELLALNWKQIVSDASNLILVEWPEQVGLTHFEPMAHLNLEIVDGVYEITTTYGTIPL